ncbi:GxxExxY protein [Paludibacter sp.]|uniref:GxxExxY protein n=1 Tax=Paludibacter sp. TaxID=1898105 RepID=UPI001354B8F7|nr:GxxExxY protein [Paludibacter sp.]MTK53521.1 GxxExxY protein [Paludibacter sp.]
MTQRLLKQTDYEQIGQKILNCAFEVHKNLGPGLLESVYEVCLLTELKNSNLSVKSQVELPVFYKGEKLNKTFYIDILVEDAIVIELKSVEVLLPVHEIQMLTYMKLGDFKLGFLLNFNESMLKNGIRRKVNNYHF